MSAITTYVFIDIGAPGLRKDNPSPIISLSLLAVSSKDFQKITDENREDMITDPPIQRQKYFHLVYGGFNPEEEIFGFIKPLDKPVCLIAHSSFNYDFPILKSMLSSRGESFFEDMSCADSMAAFYDITMKPEDDKKATRAERLSGSFPWPNGFFDQPGFGLSTVYERELEGTEYYKRHVGCLDDLDTTRGRNVAVLRVAVKLSDDFPLWVEKNCYRFAEVPLHQEN